MPTYASGPFTRGKLGFESSPGVLPGTPDNYLLPFGNIQQNPNVPDFADDAMDGSLDPREWVAGKFGPGGSFSVTGSRDSMPVMMKATFGAPTTYGSTGSYDHYFSLSSSSAPSFFFQHEMTDTTTDFFLALGNRISSWQQQCTFQGLFKPQFNFMGSKLSGYDTNQLGAGTTTDATGSRALNYITATVEFDGTLVAYIKTLSWNLDLKMQGNDGMDGTPYHLAGAILPNALFTLNVDFTAHYLNRDFFDAALAGTQQAVAVRAPAVETGHGVKTWLPAGKYKPFGISATGASMLEQRFGGMFYRNATSLVAAETLSKGFTSVTVVNASNDTLILTTDIGDETFDLTTGANTPATIAATVNATGVNVEAVVEWDDENDHTKGGRVAFRRKNQPGPTGSIQVKAASTCESLLGLHNTAVSGWKTSMLVRCSNAVASYA